MVIWLDDLNMSIWFDVKMAQLFCIFLNGEMVKWRIDFWGKFLLTVIW